MKNKWIKYATLLILGLIVGQIFSSNHGVVASLFTILGNLTVFYVVIMIIVEIIKSFRKSKPTLIPPTNQK